jgi:predicted transglutaminase-like cysteine proteinase
LVTVNDDVNLSVVPATDQSVFGREEVWGYPNGIGDCEDMALLKRRELIADGWPVGALLMTVVRQRDGEGHAVLTVLTDRGDLILDNLDGHVRVWSETPYQFVKRQSQFNSGQWTTINDARTTSVGSTAR